MKWILRITLAALLCAGALPAQSRNESTDKRFDAIKAKHDRGEPLTPDEQNYAQSVIERRNQANAAGRNQEYARDHPPKDFTGLIPLTDLGAVSYKGEQGGLYPGGQNTPPPSHAKAGLALAAGIVPLDKQGHPASDGKIVFITIGMSNTTQESRAFQDLAAQDHDLNPHLVIVDGAQGGQTAAITAKPDANYWTVAAQRLNAAGVTPEQVQAAWLKQANAGPKEPFPVEAKKLQADIAATVHNLHVKYPNLKLVYLSSRIYAGYAGTPLNPEPHAYETAFAVKWLIADQIAAGSAGTPWLAWGPYLWADGVNGRKDGLTYSREDLGPDGTHPAAGARKKVAQQLLHFLKNDPTSRPWFLAKAAQSPALRSQTQDLQGIVDLHAHSDPDSVPRSIDAIDLAKLAHSRGMRALLLKNHYEPTASLAYLVRKEVPGIDIFGGIVLNRTVGGINPAAVERMTKVKGGFGRVVWMPTFDAENQVRYSKEDRPFVSVSRAGSLLPEVLQVLDIVARNHLTLATGHSSPAEVLSLVRAARQRGIDSIIVTHGMLAPVVMTISQMQQAARMGAKIEFVYNALIGPNKMYEVSDYVRAIRAIGPENCFLSSDLGQAGNPLHTDGFQAYLHVLSEAGISQSDLDTMSKTNPAKLLGYSN